MPTRRRRENTFRKFRERQLQKPPAAAAGASGENELYLVPGSGLSTVDTDEAAGLQAAALALMQCIVDPGGRRGVIRCGRGNGR